MDEILFICEGEKSEKQFCNFIIDKYFIQNNKVKEFVSFGTNIYGLYDEMKRDNGLDIVELVKERAKEQKKTSVYSKLNEGHFSEVYLIFDFDFHAPQYSSDKIKEMVNFFNNETENGKLYINYPMLESFKHFRNIPDLNFNNYKVLENDCYTYKRYIGEISIIPHINDIDFEKLKIIIKQSLDKFALILGCEVKNYNQYLGKLTQINLLKKQLDCLKNDSSIYVINTSLFWGIDYFGEEKFNEYNSVIIKEREKSFV